MSIWIRFEDLKMDSDNVQGRPVPIEGISSGEVEARSNNISLEVVSSVGDTIRALECAAEILTKLELNLACSSEKLVNLSILVMHVAARENDFEAFAFEEEKKAEGPVGKALEFDILHGILDSEVRELESFLFSLQSEIVNSQENVSSFKHIGNAYMEMEGKMVDCEDTLKQCFEQVSDIKMQSANFERILSASSGYEKCKDDKKLAGLETGNCSYLNAKIKMQTAEQQRNILRMLEKSLAREMDLEKKLTESRLTEEGLRHEMQQELYCMEEEAEETWGRLFEAENSSEILLGVSKELFGRIQIAQLTLNGSTQREVELQSNIQHLNEQLKEKDSSLKVSETYRTELVDKAHSLERELQLKLCLLEEKAAEAEKRAEIAEADCKLLIECKLELSKDVSLLKSSMSTEADRLEQLRMQFKDSEMKRNDAVASAEAGQEKQIMLERTVHDMDNLINNLKSKVLKAENLADSAEEKCIILSETNAKLIEEINFLRVRTQHLETSLHQAEDAKKGTTKDIRVRTKVIADLVVQLALERERLHKQMYSLVKEKKVALRNLQQIKDREAKVKEVVSDIEMKNVTSKSDSSGSSSTKDEIGSEVLNSPRDIGARQLKCKHVLIAVVVLMMAAILIQFCATMAAVVVLMISALAAILFQQPS